MRMLCLPAAFRCPVGEYASILPHTTRIYKPKGHNEYAHGTCALPQKKAALLPVSEHIFTMPAISLQEGVPHAYATRGRAARVRSPSVPTGMM